MIEIVLAVLAVYLALGVLFALVFHFAGLKKVDPVVAGGGFFFRLLITPGIAGLWPVMLAKWARSGAGATYGATEAPVSSAGLRAYHRRLVGGLGVLLPLAVVAAVAVRPAAPPAQPVLKPVAAPLDHDGAVGTAVVGAVPLQVALQGTEAARQLEIEIPEDLLVPGAVLYWSEQPAAATPAGAVFLGSVGPPGKYRFPIPAGAATGTVILYSTGHGEVAATFPLQSLRAGSEG
jgi:hypothetical protein